MYQRMSCSDCMLDGLTPYHVTSCNRAKHICLHDGWIDVYTIVLCHVSGHGIFCPHDGWIDINSYLTKSCDRAKHIFTVLWMG